ncbi:MAG: glycosyltransferase family 39 protein, partial [Anaerolineales bacterium]
MMKSDSISKKSSSVAGYLVLVGIILLASFLRFHKLGDESFWVDEIGHIQAANSQNITSLLSNVRIHAGAAPLDYLILYLVNPLIEGYLNSSYRLIYAFYGILAVFATYVLGKMIKGAEVGLLSAFLLAISPFHIKYSQEVRFYSLSLLISVFSFICLITALKRKSRRSWIILGVVNILGLYTFYYFVFFILFELLFVFLSLSDDIGPSRVREIFRCFEMRWAFLVTVLVILAFVPWILWDDSTSSLVLNFPFHIHPINALFDFGMQIGGIFVFTLFLLIILPNVFQKYSLTFLLITVGSVLGAVLVDNLFNYFFSPRQVLFVLPFLFCAVSISIKDFLRKILKF